MCFKIVSCAFHCTGHHFTILEPLHGSVVQSISLHCTVLLKCHFTSCTLPKCTSLHSSALQNTTTPFSRPLHCTPPQCTGTELKFTFQALHCTTYLHCTQHGAVRHCTALHATVQHCTALQYTSSYSSALYEHFRSAPVHVHLYILTRASSRLKLKVLI